MSFDFPLILFSLTVFSGVVCLIDWAHEKKSPSHRKQLPTVVDYCRSFFPVLLLVFIIRSFAIQPYRVPTGSLEPTVMPGDFILVKQYRYGVRFPVWDKQFIPYSKPKRGQIALFHDPVNWSVNFVKRVVGVPGDDISYINKVFYINGKKMDQKYIKMGFDSGPGRTPLRVKIMQENLMGVEHRILINPSRKGTNFYHLKVPKGEYLMIGDNRDDSDDSRYWGFVPERNFIGQAFMVWMSWDVDAKWTDKIQWHRIGTHFYDA